MKLATRWGRFVERYAELAAAAPPLKPFRAYVNWARANLEMVLRRGRIRAAPLKLTFDPTNVCQLRCPLCPTGASIQDRGKGHARMDVFERLLDEVGDYVFFIDFFNWGEPLLNPRIEELIQLASRRRISTHVSTNLSVPLSDERLRRLIASGLNGLVCSLDGASQATYEKYRRRGNFALAFDNMRRLLRLRRDMGARGPVVTWQFLVFKFNEHEMDDARRMASEIGVDLLAFRAPYLDEGRYPLSDADVASIATWRSTDAAHDRYHPSHPEYVDAAAKPRARCDWHYMSSALNWDGSVAPCCTVFKKEDDFGSLLDGDRPRAYMDVLNNEKFVGIRERFAGRRRDDTGLICERCPTPSLMSYGTHVNHRIALLTLAGLMSRLRRAWPASWLSR